MNYWGIFFASTGGTTGILILAFFIVKNWLKKKIEADVQHKYNSMLEDIKNENAKELEGFKAGYQKVLDENQVRFSWYYSERAQVIKELYKQLAEFNDALQPMVQSCKFFSPSIDAEEQIRKEQTRCMKTYEDSRCYYEKNKLLLSEEHISKLDDLYQRAKSSMLCYESSIMKKANLGNAYDDSKEAEKLAKPIKAILDGLRKEFRAILNGEEVQNAE